MTKAEEKFHLEGRKARMARVAANPEEHKVCECCRSVWKLRTRICGICGAYRWEYDREIVLATAAIIARHPFPQTLGTVPRLS